MFRRKFLPLLLLSAAAVAGCNTGQPPAVVPKPPDVIVSRAVLRAVTDSEEFQGKTEAEKAVDVRARVGGYLDKFNFKDGAEVREKDVLFEIDPRPFAAELERAEANMSLADAHQKRLEYDYGRADNLLRRKAISQEEFDKVAGDLSEARSSLKAARAARDIAQLNLDYSRVTSPISGRISRRFVDPGNMVKADDTILTRIVSLDPMYAYFDIDERTHLRLQRFRDRRAVALGTAHLLLEAAGPRGLAPPLAAAVLLQSDVLNQQAQAAVSLALADEPGFLDKEGQVRHPGTIDFEDNRVDPDSGSVWLRGVFPNPRKLLTPGLFVRVRLPVGEAHPAVLIPERALATDQGEKYVWVLDKDDHARYHKIKLGAQQDHGLRVVVEGIQEGDRVIATGLQRVRIDRDKGYAEVKILREYPADREEEEIADEKKGGK
jgi:RND family efflux transporter MFP subunit